MPEPKIAVKDVSVSYRLPNGRQLEALQDITFDVEPNDFLVLIGPSGCGKSTLLNVIAGLAKPDRGTVALDGSPMDAPRPRDVALMFQDPLLLPWRNVLRNIQFGLEAQHLPKDEMTERALKYLRLVGLESFRDAFPHQLSGGMKQRVALCRALALETEVILMDEPFGALDEQTRFLLANELVNIWMRLKKTIVFVTHSLDEALYLGERIVTLSFRPGRVKALTTVDLPRPRDVVGLEFRRYLDTLNVQLREEILKGSKQDFEFVKA